MNKHTPGPWEIKGQEVFGNAPNGYICTWSGNSSNALLIAAAPDLLEELKRMVAYYKPHEIRIGTRFEALGKIKDAEQAIKKAEGE